MIFENDEINHDVFFQNAVSFFDLHCFKVRQTFFLDGTFYCLYTRKSEYFEPRLVGFEISDENSFNVKQYAMKSPFEIGDNCVSQFFPETRTLAFLVSSDNVYPPEIKVYDLTPEYLADMDRDFLL